MYHVGRLGLAAYFLLLLRRGKSLFLTDIYKCWVEQYRILNVTFNFKGTQTDKIIFVIPSAWKGQSTKMI